MARKRGKKSSKKDRNPTSRFLYYDLEGSTGVNPDSFYIDLAKDLSLTNRRLYRQGMQYHIANVTVIDTYGDTKVKFCTLPDVWTTQKGWRNMFDAWKDQRALVLENAPNFVTGRWADFKAYMSYQHFLEGNITPVDSDGGALAVPADWDYSQISFNYQGADKNDQHVFMLGPHQMNAASPTLRGIGILAALEEVLQRPPESPALPAAFEDSVILGMNPTVLDSNVDVLSEIAADNDLPPYSTTIVMGAGTLMVSNDQSLVSREVGWWGPGTGIFSDPSGIASLSAMGFPVPLGLLEVQMDSSQDRNTIGIIIEMVPGSYKGVLAEAF